MLVRRDQQQEPLQEPELLVLVRQEQALQEQVLQAQERQEQHQSEDWPSACSHGRTPRGQPGLLPGLAHAGP